MSELTAYEFNRWLRDCVDNARKRGLPEREIFLEVLNLARRLTVDMMFEENRATAREKRERIGS